MTLARPGGQGMALPALAWPTLQGTACRSIRHSTNSTASSHELRRDSLARVKVGRLASDSGG